MKKALLILVAVMAVGVAYAARPLRSQVAVEPLNNSGLQFEKVQLDVNKVVNEAPSFDASKINFAKAYFEYSLCKK